MSSNFRNPGLEGNPHFVDVTCQAESDAQGTSATLAAAYEQRTATLVALLVAGFNSVQIAGVDYSKLADTIKERLGL